MFSNSQFSKILSAQKVPSQPVLHSETLSQNNNNNDNDDNEMSMVTHLKSQFKAILGYIPIWKPV